MSLQEPVSRNRYYGGYPGHPQSFYDAMSLNSNLLPFAAGICGGQVRQNHVTCDMFLASCPAHVVCTHFDRAAE